MLVVGATGPVLAAPRPYQLVDLGSLGGPYAQSRAAAVNDYDATVGVSQAPNGPHGTLWQPDGTKVALGREPLPVDINNRGDIAYAGTYSYVRHADGSKNTNYPGGLMATG